MSIRAPIDSLSIEQRKNILKDCQVQNLKTKEWIYMYDFEEDDIMIPYAYAKSMGLSTKKRDEYESADIDFTAKLREYQNKVKKETISRLNKTGSCILSLHVGWGKSVFALYLASKLKFKTLIIVKGVVLIKQWNELILDMCPNTKVQILKNNKTIKDEDADIYIMNCINVKKFDSSAFNNIGTVICDEIHLLAAQTLFKALYKLTPKYFIGLSATPYRPDGLDVILDIYFGKFKIIEKLNKKHNVYPIHSGFKIKHKLNWEGKIDWNSVINNQAEKEGRNEMLVDIIQKFKDRNFLVLCKRVAHGEKLYDMLIERGEDATMLLGTKRDFDKESRILIATTQKCGVGFSHNKLNTLLLAADVEEYFIQYLGRVFRTPEVEPMIFDIVDSHPVLRKHFNTRKMVYSSVGGIVKEVVNIKAFLRDF